MSAAEYLNRGYARRLTPNPEGGFTGTIQEFPGLVAEGETAAEALANLETAAEGWIESTLHAGNKVPDPVELGGYSGKIALRIPRGLHKRAAEMASSEGVSLNQWLVSAVAHYLGTEETVRYAVDRMWTQFPQNAVFGNNNYTFVNWNTYVTVQDSSTPNAFLEVGTGSGSVLIRPDERPRSGYSWLKPLNTALLTKT